MVDLKELYTQFKKSEIMSIAKELDIKIAPDMQSKLLTEKIISNLDKEGIPEIDDCSDLLGEFLIAANYIDEDGNLLEDDDDNGKEEDEASEGELVKLPECYTFEDDRDPACKKCPLKTDCYKERITNRPECFGKMFRETDEECIACIEASDCSQIKL